MTAIKAYANSDHAYVVWQLDARVPDCRGFALHRRMSGHGDDVLDSWVGFAGDTAPPGTKKPSTEWPIQKFMWSDYDVQFGKKVSYRAVPMIGTTKDALHADDAHATDWSEPVTAGASVGRGMHAYFNRGIVATQWLARQLKELGGAPGTALQQIISTPGNRVRNFLGGAIIRELTRLLEQVKADGTEVYAALYELDDPELLDALKALEGKANVVLANGADLPDENKASRQELKDAGVNVVDRLVSSRHFAHNKYLVLCDQAGAPRAVWTGSTNWTKTGLCTQANNALLIEDATIASWYRSDWDALEAAGSSYPTELLDTDDQPHSEGGSSTSHHVWFAPVRDLVDLEDARARINDAREGIVFLMFNPGPTGTLLNDIVERTATASPTYDPDLYIHGVLNQDPSTEKHPIIGLFHRGTYTEADIEVVLPAAIDTDFGFWIKELEKLPRSHAMVHSKCIVLDPFGGRPVVMTGSHNMGPKASAQNDENLVIVEGMPKLAAAYAVNIMGVYNQYRWRYRQLQATKEKAGHATVTAAAGAEPTWAGLQDGDAWQNEYFKGSKARELRFWLGQDSAA
ncbi:MAG TPA: phospholipase D-like domain-containing protein [Gaiellaceae bacterium]|nr:phospholipase D-like domain-containing protein [Gaiellaceae bacterium]